jgi:hypothetical protein
MPTYTLDGRWRQWVVALSVTKDAVNLRFLWGVLLEDPLKVLRPGTSTLMTWDFPRGGTVDAAAVASYVREALDKRDAELAALLERFSRFGGPAGLPEREKRPRSAGEVIRRSSAAPRRGRRGAPVQTA